MTAATLIAVDWGTTNRRVYALGAGGEVLATESDGGGVLSTPRDGFAAAVAAIRERFGDAPMLCAGMVGSDRGWVQVPYVDCPAGVDDLAAGLHWIERGRTAIVPGVADRGDAPDIMRGEEVQLLGAILTGRAPPEALLVLPGTHCKWARALGGRIASFRTAMTGELFALIRQHSLLGGILQGAVTNDAAFRDGAALARRGTLLSSLFGERARVVLGRGDATDGAARVSGLLIGSDVREAGLRAGERAYILADPALGALYASAIGAAGGEPVLLDSGAAFVAGIHMIWEKAR